jgi:exonuclease V gamma subunit
MNQSVRLMLECHWSARHVQRYLDADPSAPLTQQEVQRLEEHLMVCERCTGVVQEHRALRRALTMTLGPADLPDQQAVGRLRRFVADLTQGQDQDPGR